MFAELIDRKIKDVKSVARHVGFAVCCLDNGKAHFVVEVWVEEAILLTMKAPCINFEGVLNNSKCLLSCSSSLHSLGCIT